MRGVWLAVSAISTGFGIWATHFVAMLAFTPGIPSGYNIVLTILSLIAAILLTGAGLAVSLTPNWRHGPWIGGAIVAGGIAAMHYTGMAAFEIAGIVLWDPALVVASIVLGAAIGAAALPVGLHGKDEKWKIGGAVLLTLAICSHHFTAMGAVSIIPDPTIEISQSALPAGWLAVGVALASFAIIGLALAGVVLDIRDRRRSELEVDRMRDLANASVEGLLVCDGETIVSVNTSFAALTGLSASDLVGARLESCFPDRVARARLLSGSNLPVETSLRHLDGSMTPVELILRPIVFAGRPHQVVAVRDLQARKEAEQHIHYLAHHDALTSLPNRGHFNARIDQEIAALAKGESLAVLCLDLDRFKEVNDLFGHAAGDTVLQTVASRVTAVLGERQMMARLGGDEFAVLMPGVANPAAASRLAETILEALRTASDTPETNSISTSIGIALYPDDATDRQSLLTHADTALYRAKTEGRNTYRFFEATMGAEVRERRMLEHDLRLAIARDELRLVYQPQKDVQEPSRHRLRSSAALEAPDARRDFACHLHPDCRGDRRHPGDRRLGADDGLPRGRDVDAAADGRGQRLGRAALQCQLRPGAAPDPAGNRPAAAPAGDRDHRDGAGSRFQSGADHAAADQGARCPHRDGRFRHRLFVALEPARVSVRQDQDRRLVHQVGQHQRSGRDDRSGGAGPWPRARPAGAGRRRRDRRRACNSCRTNFAMRCRAICSDARPRLAAFATLHMRMLYWI